MEYGNKVNPRYSEVIKDFRARTGLSQEKAAQALGVRRATISDWENGKTSARDFLAGVRFALLALKQGVSVEDLILSYPDPPLSVGEEAGEYQT